METRRFEGTTAIFRHNFWDFVRILPSGRDSLWSGRHFWHQRAFPGVLVILTSNYSCTAGERWPFISRRMVALAFHEISVVAPKICIRVKNSLTSIFVSESVKISLAVASIRHQTLYRMNPLSAEQPGETTTSCLTVAAESHRKIDAFESQDCTQHSMISHV